MKFIKKIYQSYKEIIHYFIVGVLTMLVSLSVKYILLFTILNVSNPLDVQIAVTISWICAVAFAYSTNRIFVFHSKEKKILKEIISFVSGRILTLFLEMFIMWFLITFLKLNTNLWVIISTFICQIIITVSNYIISKVVVFKK